MSAEQNVGTKNILAQHASQYRLDVVCEIATARQKFSFIGVTRRVAVSEEGRQTIADRVFVSLIEGQGEFVHLRTLIFQEIDYLIQTATHSCKFLLHFFFDGGFFCWLYFTRHEIIEFEKVRNKSDDFKNDSWSESFLTVAKSGHEIVQPRDDVVISCTKKTVR